MKKSQTCKCKCSKNVHLHLTPLVSPVAQKYSIADSIGLNSCQCVFSGNRLQVEVLISLEIVCFVVILHPKSGYNAVSKYLLPVRKSKLAGASLVDINVTSSVISRNIIKNENYANFTFYTFHHRV